METISTILEHFGKAGNIAALFASTLGLFVFIEKMSSKQAQADFTKYLKSTNFAGSVVHLPEDTRALFERVFGTRHFSLRCVITSVLFSVAATAGMFGLLFLNSSIYLYTFVGWWEDRSPALVGLGKWIIWSFVPDYFNLLKTRAALHMMTAHQINRASVLILIILADFVIGYAIFSLPLGLILGFGELKPSEILIPLSSAFSQLFWASMIPSVWLWLYVAATLIVRLAVRSAPLLRFLMYLLDIDQHPIRSVGIVAAVLVSGAYAILLAISKFAQVLSDTLETA